METKEEINPKTGQPYKRSKEARQNMSNAHRNNEKVLEANRNKTQQTKDKISATMQKHEVSEETREKMRLAKVGKPRPRWVIEKMLSEKLKKKNENKQP